MGLTYAVIGAGRTGRAAAFDLALNGEGTQVRLFDVDVALAQRAAGHVNDLLAARGRPRVAVGAALDAGDQAAVARAIAGAQAVLSCAPYWFNADLAASAVEQHAHFNDLGGNTEVVRRELALDAAARQAGVSVVPDCGLAPGLVNTLAAAGIGRLVRCERVQLRCGGLPQKPRPPLDYALSFSISGLTNEYTGVGFCVRDGQVAQVPTLTELEEISFDGFPPLEAFVTSGGTSTAPESFADRVRSYDYKTIRYRGHCDKLRLLDALGLFALDPVVVQGTPVVPRRLFEAVAGPRPTDPALRDVILTRATCSGELPGGGRANIVFELVDRFDEATGFSAMERSTAYAATAVTYLQASGRVAAGARPLELCVDPEPYLKLLPPRTLSVVERTERL